MLKSASLRDHSVDEPLELRSVPVVDSSEYVARILCTGCGRDFDVLRTDSAGYDPFVPAHAHGTPDVGGGSFAGCRSLSVVPIETEPPRRVAGSATRSAKKSSFQTLPGRGGVSIDGSGACSCPGTSTMSDACADSTSASAYGRSRRDTARRCEFWRNVDESHLSVT